VSVVLDASAVAKLLIEEPGSDVVRGIVATEPHRLAPELLVAEVGNMLWRRMRNGTTPVAAADRLMRAVPRAVTSLEALAPLSQDALEIALRHNHPIYDCFYVALARRESSALVTADRRLAQLAAVEGVEARLIAAQPSSSA
jgi:predicted nucleic acid-binding protein